MGEQSIFICRTEKIRLVKKTIKILIAVSFVLAAAFMTNTNAGYAFEGEHFSGSECTGSKTAAAAIDYCMTKYPDNAVYTENGNNSSNVTGTGFEYAKKVRQSIASESKVKKLSLPFSEDNMKKYLLNAKVGAQVVLYGEEEKHSIIVLKASEGELWWTESNLYADDRIGYYRTSWDEAFQILWKFDMIEKIYLPNKYRLSEAPKAAVQAKDEGVVQLSWTKSKASKSYVIYRSNYKSKGYRKIATVSSCNYIDTNAALGVKQYYKVKTAGGKYSNVVSAKRKLGMPVEISAESYIQKGKLMLSWEKVSEATSYRLERYDALENKYVKIATLKDEIYCDTVENGLAESDFTEADCTYYRLRSYDKNSGKISAYHYFCVWHSENRVEDAAKPLEYMLKSI